MDAIREDSFVHLHQHSYYSFKDSPMSLDQLAGRVAELGQKAAALTEHGNMYSAILWDKACRAVGVAPLIGCETYMIPDPAMAESDNPAISHIKYHMTLLAKDYEGYKQLSKAITKAQLLKDKKQYPRMTVADMEQFFIGGHVVALSGCMQGEISVTLQRMMALEASTKEQLEALERAGDTHGYETLRASTEQILKGIYEEAKAKALLYERIFGKGNFFIEIQNHGIPEEIYTLPKLIQIARETQIPLVATNDAHYARPEDAAIRDLVVALRFGQKVTDPDFRKDGGQLYVKSTQEMHDLFRDVPDAVANTVRIAEMCHVEFPKEKHFPRFPLPEGVSEEQYLRDMSYEGLQKRFPDFDHWPGDKRQVYLDRLEYELQTIEKLNFSGYIDIVADISQFQAKVGEKGRGRGSAAGSLVLFLTEVTEEDPIADDLLFERFLNAERVSDPDVDMDMDDTRDQILDYVKQKYGENSVCQIITFGKMAAKAAIRNVGRVLGKPLDLCDRVSKMVPNGAKVTLSKALEENPDLKALYETNREVQELIDTARKVEGVIIQSGIHAAGVIIGDRDLTEYIPLAFDEKKQVWVSQYDMNVVQEDAGLLKMDFLGLETLTVMKRAFRDVERLHGEKVTMNGIPRDDAAVMREIFAKGRTKGVFQFESPGMVRMLQQFQPSRFADLVLLNAAFRPGPMQYLPEVIDVKHGRKKPSYIVPAMEPLLAETYSKPIYQEQIMKIFQMVGFTLGTADIIRRAMSKKKEKELKKYLPTFEEGLVKASASPTQAKDFSAQMMDFSEYAFNKSHADSYSDLAWRTGWMKHHYPVEFMASVMTSANNKKLPLYIKETRSMGIPLLSPSVNESGLGFTPTKSGTIRYGLGMLKNVGKAAEIILTEREAHGAFASLQNAVERLVLGQVKAINKKVWDSLILTGALDEFGLSRKAMQTHIEGYIKAVKHRLEVQEKGTATRTEHAPLLESALMTIREAVTDLLPSERDDQAMIAEMCAASAADLGVLAEHLGLYTSAAKSVAKTKSNEKARAATLEKWEGVARTAASVILETLGYAESSSEALSPLPSEFMLDEALVLKKAVSALEKNRAALAASETAIAEALTAMQQEAREFAKDEILAHERELMGFYASGHPLDSYKAFIEEHADADIADLDEDSDDQEVTLVGQITEFMPLYTKKDGKPMGKFVLEDLTGSVNCVVFSRAFAELKDLIKVGAVVKMKGRVGVDVEKDPDTEEVLRLELDVKVSYMEPAVSRHKVYVRYTAGMDWNAAKALLGQHSGSDPCLIYDAGTKKMYAARFTVQASQELAQAFEDRFGPGTLAIA